MNEFDREVKNALSKEDEAFLAGLQEEPPALKQIAGVFSGPLGRLHAVFFVAAVLFGIGAVYACWRFAVSDSLRPLAYWGSATAFCVVALSVVRVVLFVQLQTNRVLRELKRIELQVALLAARSGN
jgi:hypothetical protein